MKERKSGIGWPFTQLALGKMFYLRSSAVHYDDCTSAFAKMWLSFKRLPCTPSAQPRLYDATIAHFTQAIEQEYSILNTRLSKDDQRYLALPDRPTIADFATFPFANAQVAQMAGITFEKWDKLKEWSDRMMQLLSVVSATRRLADFV